MFTRTGMDALHLVLIRFVCQIFLPDVSYPCEKRMINKTYSANIPIGFYVRIIYVRKPHKDKPFSLHQPLDGRWDASVLENVKEM